MKEAGMGVDIKRIGWLDVCRGILIVLMVIGHSTSLFNKYIYQFHMAAFFFLSGYGTHPERTGFFRTLFDKFFTVFLPMITTILLGFIALWLLHFGDYDILLSTWAFPGWKHALTALFTQGDIYVDVLGANWFLITLFGVCVLNKLVHLFTNNSMAGYCIVSLALYVISYGILHSVEYGIIRLWNIPHLGMFQVDLVLIGNMFFTLGHFAKKTGILQWVAESKVVRRVSFAVSLGGALACI